MKALLVIIMNLCLHVTYAQKPDTTKTFIQGKELGEVVVKSSYLTREGDHILAIPTTEQRKHAVTGYDLLSNLLTSSLRHPKIFIKEFGDFLMPFHQHCLSVYILVQR